jgi:hypothetical protein
MSVKLVAAPVAAALAALTNTAATKDHAEIVATHHSPRTVGYGQIRYEGAGPERWALRFRRERRVVTSLRRELSARLDRLVYLVRSFECVHRFEGAWGSNTGNGYFGGLQFGSTEWRRWGGRYAASADQASPSEQITAAIAYHALAGFYPWPNTARACGLIR